MLARKFVLVKPFEGLPKLTDFQIVEETIPAELQDGGNVLYVTGTECIKINKFFALIRNLSKSRMVDG